jgi:EF hand
MGSERINFTTTTKNRHDDKYIGPKRSLSILMERTMKFSKTVFSILTVLSASAAFNAFAQTAAPVTGAPAEASSEKMKAHGHGFAALDKNGDGVISREEAAGRPRLAKMFDTLDINKDGGLSKEEMKAAHDKMQAKGMARIDTDRDGRISRTEAAGRPRLAENFDRIDANGDGFLSMEEIAAAHKMRAAAHAPK